MGNGHLIGDSGGLLGLKVAEYFEDVFTTSEDEARTRKEVFAELDAIYLNDDLDNDQKTAAYTALVTETGKDTDASYPALQEYASLRLAQELIELEKELRAEGMGSSEISINQDRLAREFLLDEDSGISALKNAVANQPSFWTSDTKFMNEIKDVANLMAKNPLAREKAEALQQEIDDAKTEIGDNAASTLAAMTTEEDTTADKVSLARVAYQCFLTHHVDQLAEHHRKKLSDRAEDDSFSLEGIIEGYGMPSGMPGSRILLVTDSTPGASFMQTNKMTSLGKFDGIETVSKSQIAKVGAAMKVSKVLREGSDITGKIPMPCLTGQIFTANKTTDGKKVVHDIGTREGASAAARAKHIMNSDDPNVLSPVSISSFDWSFAGSDPFTATRDIKATMNLQFQSFSGLMADRDSKDLMTNKATTYKVIDLVLQPECPNKKPEPEPIEEAAPSVSIAGEDLAYDPECYEIEVEIGYFNVAAGMPACFKDVEKLYLTMVEHTFDFGVDGWNSLKIEFRARISTALGDKKMNVLVPGGGRLLQNDADAPPGPLNWNINNLQGMINEVREEEHESDKKKDEQTDFLAKIEKIRDIAVAQSNISLLSGIMQQLVTREYVHQVDITREEFNKFSQWGSMDSIPSNLAARVGTIGEVDDTDDTFSLVELKPTQLQENFIMTNINTGTHKIRYAAFGDIIAVMLSHVVGDRAIVPGGKGVIDSYMSVAQMKTFTKDIDFAASNTRWAELGAWTGVTDETTRSITHRKVDTMFGGSAAASESSMAYLSTDEMPTFRFLMGTLQYTPINTADSKVINMAHLPVSLDSFQNFMVERVILKNRRVYPLGDFVKDLMKQVVISAMANECFGGYFVKGGKPKLELSLVQGMGPKNKEPIENHDKLYDNFTGLKYKNFAVGMASQYTPIFPKDPSPQHVPYDYMSICAWSTRAYAKKLTGEKAQNSQMGIPQLPIRVDRGVVESFSFKKTPIEYLAEERFERQGSKNILNQLAGVYEATLTLSVGINGFRPGQYIWIDPSGMGLGFPNQRNGTHNSWSNMLGLGGYHLITEVSYDYQPKGTTGTFVTKIKALFESTGKNVQPVSEKSDG